MKLSTQKTLAFLLCLTVLAFFIIFKIAKYNLCYYTTDLFSSLQISRGWLEGYPLLWDNRYGNIASIHNYYIAVLLAPFTVFFGAKGLFIAHGFLILTALGCFIFLKDKITDENFLFGFSIIAILALGPYSFWIFDNQNYGWFCDVLFLPFCLIYAVALKISNRWLILVGGLLLVLTKEDGPVVACCIGMYAVLLNREEAGLKEVFKNLITSILFWTTIFIISLLFIYISSDFHPTRIPAAIESFKSATASVRTSYFLNILREYFILLIPLVLLFLTFFRTRFLFILLLTHIPIVIIGLISGFPYLPMHTYSITWIPRFCEVLGVFLAASVLSFTGKSLRFSARLHVKKCIFLVMMLAFFFFLQHVALQLAKGYNLTDQLLAIRNADLPAGVTTQNMAEMKCISENIPENFIVVVPENYYNFFENHKYAWIDHLQNAPEGPEIIILEKTSAHKIPESDFSDYTIEEHGDFIFLWHKKNAPDFSHCY